MSNTSIQLNYRGFIADSEEPVMKIEINVPPFHTILIWKNGNTSFTRFGDARLLLASPHIQAFINDHFSVYMEDRNVVKFNAAIDALKDDIDEIFKLTDVHTIENIFVSAIKKYTETEKEMVNNMIKDIIDGVKSSVNYQPCTEYEYDMQKKFYDADKLKWEDLK